MRRLFEHRAMNSQERRQNKPKTQPKTAIPTMGSESSGPVSMKGNTMEQLKLPLQYFPYAEYLGGFKRIRKALNTTGDTFKPWKQLGLKLYIKKLIRVSTGFFWTRPDGKQFYCKTIRSLIARIMDYDGKLLQQTLRCIR
jgi:hypothetical protein